MKEYVKNINKVTFMDIKRNRFLWLALTSAGVIYLVMIFVGKVKTEKNVWMAYAVYSYIMALFMPLIYYIRYGDKNRKIIENVVNTKLSMKKIYPNWLALYLIVIFFAEYVILSLTVGINIFNNRLNFYLLLSVFIESLLINGMCMLIFESIKRYYVALITYIFSIAFLLFNTSIFLSILCPMECEIYGVQYLIGKVLEVILIYSCLLVIDFIEGRMKR